MTPRTRDMLTWLAILLVAAIGTVVAVVRCVRIYLG